MQQLTRQAYVHYNMNRVDIFTRLVLLISVVLAILNVGVRLVSEKTVPYFYGYLVLYDLLVSVSLVTLFIVKKKTWRNMHVVLQLYVCVTIVIAAMITYYDLLFYNHLMIFVIVYFVCSIIFVLEWQFYMPTSIVAFYILYKGLTLTDSENERLIMHISFILSLFLFGVILQKTSVKLLQSFIRKKELLQVANARLHRLANEDYLTQLPNRNAYYAYVEQLLTRDEPTTVRIFIVDVDHFKGYNDTYGHPQGDIVLKRVAQQLQQFDSIYFARWGGEEFLGISVDVEQPLQQVSAQIVQAVSALQIEHAQSPIDEVVTASVGAIERQVMTLQQVEQLYSEADAALYRAKQAGRNQCVSVS